VHYFLQTNERKNTILIKAREGQLKINSALIKEGIWGILVAKNISFGHSLYTLIRIACCSK